VSTKCKFTIVRHGETEWNLSGRWQGHADAPLSERGETQALALGKRFKDEAFDAFYVSDLGRALKTAELMGEAQEFDFTRDPRLRERDLGVMQGLTTAEMRERCPDVFDAFRNEGSDYVVPEGESFRQFHDRCIEALEDYAERHVGERVLLVTHGGVLGAVFRYVTCLPLEAPRRFALLNCSVNVVEKTSEGWSMRQWGDVSHLDELESLDDL